MADSKRDANRKKTIIGASTANPKTPINIKVNPATGAVIVELA